ncbi:polysaccharide biosynthesis protein, partial [Patescibacteria group bacterium]|nr:polysaccharide biosynthesis protein [Patescibacteria group bacterium]
MENLEKLIEEFQGKNILVTGGTGSIGSEIVRQLLKYNPRSVRIFARGENAHHKLRQELGLDERRTRFIIGDIRDRDKLKLAMEGANIVFHAAAMKHVDICDNDPFEAVKTNVIGTQNIIDLARYCNVDKVISISTDKAANPEGILGVSKLMAEKLILNSFYYRGNIPTKYTCVRFGNVLGSTGSILPLLKNQIKNQSHVTITDPEMTRFVMTIPQAVHLVLNASIMTKGQEVFVLKMPAVRINSLFKAAIQYYAPLYNKKPSDIEIKIIGARSGDKKHEHLLALHETDRVLEDESMFILIPRENVWGFERKETDVYKKEKTKPASKD